MIVLKKDPNATHITTKVDVRACFEQISLTTTFSSSQSTATATTPQVTSSIPSTSTTPVPCENMEGMSNPLILPADHITTSPSLSSVDDLRDGSVDPWMSIPGFDFLPNITIILAENEEVIEADKATFIVLDNVDLVEIYARESTNDQPRLIASSLGLETISNLSLPFTPGTTAALLDIIFTPGDKSSSISVKIQLFACFEPLTTTTPVHITTPSSTTTPRLTSTTTTLCTVSDGMSDSLLIPDRSITTSASSSPKGDLRPQSVIPWTSLAGLDLDIANLTFQLVNDNQPIKLVKINFPILGNVANIEAFVVENEQDTPILVESSESDQPVSNYTLHFEPDVMATSVALHFTPLIKNLPVEVQLKIFACFKPPEVSSTSVSTRKTTTATTVTFSTTTERNITTTTSPTSTVTTHACIIRDGKFRCLKLVCIVYFPRGDNRGVI